MRKMLWGILAVAVLALIVREKVAVATDNQSHTKSYPVSTRGFGVVVGDSVTYDVPAVRNASGTQGDSLLHQIGSFTLDSDPDTIKFRDQGYVPFSVTPTLTSLWPVISNADTTFIPQATSVRDSMIIIRMHYLTGSARGTIGKGTVDWGALGPRGR